MSARQANGRAEEDNAVDVAKWRRPPLKNRWYDDNHGFDVSRSPTDDNRVRFLDEREWLNEDDVASREVERFFDLFEPQG